MDIFKLMGRIAIDASGAESDMDSFVKKASNTSKKIEKSFDKIGKAFSGTVKGIGAMGRALNQVGEATERAGRTIARGIGIGAAAVGTAVVTIGKGALDIRSSIEQGMGGADAVFQQYAYHIKNASKDAWKTAGLSVEEYLATANKMGSLFKGAGFGEMQAVEYSANLMQRAADVASIMGISVEQAMEAVTGMARGNLTMMDNIGISMNNLELEAYALSKGMKVNVETMTTAEKVGLAYEMFMERTAGYAGNYAKENETAAGSLQTLKAAWSNFLGGVGTFEDLEKSAFGYLRIAAKTMGLDALEPMINGAQETVRDVAEILSMEDMDGRQKFANVRRYLLAKSVTLASAMGEKIVQGASTASGLISETLSDINVSLPHYIEVGQDIFDSVRDGVKQASEKLEDTAAIVAPALISNWFTMKTDFIGIGLGILGSVSKAISDDLALGDDSQVGASLKNGLQTILQGMSDNLPKMTGLATALIDGLSNALASEDADGTSAGEKAGQAVEGIVNEMGEWVEGGGVGRFTQAATSFLMGLGAELVDKAPTVLSGFVKGIWDGLTGILSGVTNFFSDEDTKEMQALKESLTAISESFTATQSAIDMATSAYETSMADLNTRLAMAEGHLQTIKDLEAAAVLTPEQNKEWENAVRAIVALYPELGQYVDEETRRFTENSDAIRANIAALQELARQKALQMVQAEYTDKAAELTKQIVEKQAAITQAQKQYDEKAAVLALLEQRKAEYQAGAKQGIYNYNDSFNTMETDLLRRNLEHFEEYFEIIEDGSSKYKRYGEAWDKALDIDSAFGKEAQDEYDAAQATLDTAKATLEGQMQELEALTAKAQEVADAFAVAFPAVESMASAASNATRALNSIPSGRSGLQMRAKGAVFSAPTIFDTRLGRQMVGEAGPEAVAPISVLQKYVHAAVQAANASRDGVMAELENAILELREGINTNMNLYINKKHVASAMSRDMGRSIGNREYALMRGMGG